ncbi:MAG: pilus assembly protein PilP [Gammaproteobacteria bacterium]|nr:pilus assembly protein PilP [Gammaproteobacteria bacterium]MBU1777506.1 pilus assembly protein PilP [Gammaproteobacteria bacterium]MBU1968039.1 pilus assembly protein PilP [Gammaproteobacteria bacterium]
MKPVHAFLLTFLLLAGCGGEEFQDLRDFVKNAGADMRGKVDPPPDMKPYEPFTYDNDTGLPDPFKQRKADARNSGRGGLNQPNLDRPKEELEDYPLESLKLVGYLYQKGVGHALIKSSEGKLYRVKAGNYIGLNYGQVVSVTENEMKIREMVQDSVGDWSERENTLLLIE